MTLSVGRLMAATAAGLLLVACAGRRRVSASLSTPPVAVTVHDDTNLEPFLESFPLQVSPPADSPPPRWDTPSLRRLILQIHPAVLSAQAALDRVEALQRSTALPANPEFEARVMLSGSSPEAEGALTFALPLGGTTQSRRHLATLDVRLALVDLDTAYRTALLDLERRQYRLAHGRARKALYEEVAQISAQYAEIARQRRASTLADPLDVSLVLVEMAHDQRSLTRSAQDVARIENDLRSLLALPPGTSLPTPSLDHYPIPLQFDELLSLADTYRGDWCRSKLELERAQQQVSLARRARIPQPKVGPAIRSDGESASLGIAAGLEIPLFHTGGREYRAALAGQAAAQSALEWQARLARGELESLVHQLASIEVELRLLEEDAIPPVEQALSLARIRYDAGQLDALRLLSAHRSFTDLKLEELDLLLTWHEIRLDLTAAIGHPPPRESNP